MTALTGIRNAQLNLELLIVTIVLVPFQVLLLFSTIVLSENPETFVPTIGLNSIPYFIAYFILTVVYCTLASLLFRPKRIISPVNVQLGTAVTFSIILIYRILTFTNPKTISQLTTILGNQTSSMVVITIILLFTGFYQLLIVNWIVGVNFFGLDKKTYSVTGSIQRVDKVLQFLTLRRYTRHLGPNGEIIYRKRTNDQVIISLSSGSTLGSSTLATVAFHKGIYSLEPSKIASDFRDSVIFELSARLAAHDSSIKITEIHSFDDPASICAHNCASSYSASKIPSAESFGAILERISTFYRIIIGITLFSLIGITIVYWVHFNQFDFNTYVTITVGLLIALFIEVGIPLREEIIRHKT
jgi:hypothetical protein